MAFGKLKYEINFESVMLVTSKVTSGSVGI